MGDRLVGTAETAIAMERIETMMDCFILKSWEWEQEFCDLGKMIRMMDKWSCLVTVYFLRCSDGSWTSMNGGRFLYLRCRSIQSPLSIT